MVTQGVKNSHREFHSAAPPKMGHMPQNTKVHPAPAQRPVDQTRVASGPINPYEGVAKQAVSVTVDGWKKGPNDCMERILGNQGYSVDEMYRQDEHGRSLIGRVSEVNGLKDPNLLATNRKLLVPSKNAPAPENPKEFGGHHAADTRKGAERMRDLGRHVEPAPQPATDSSQSRPFRSNETKKGAELLMQHSKPGPTVNFQPRKPTHPVQVRPAVSEAVAGPVAPESKPAVAVPTNMREAASVEVGMLTDGVKDHKFTRDEFRALNSTANQFTELRARSAKAGFTPQRTAQLAQVQQQYGQMYARFLADDKAKIRFAGEKDASPAAQFHAAQNREGGQLYDEFAAGQINETSLKSKLMDQRESASVRGLQVADPVKRHSFLYRVFHKSPKEQ